MNRRILDEVTINALAKYDDKNLTEFIKERFGEGSLVKDAKTPVVRFDKSMFGLTKFSFISTVRLLAKEFHTGTGEGTIVNSNGDSITVDSKAIGILKALCLYSTTCPIVLKDCIRSVLNEIDNYFTNGVNNDLVIITLEESNEGKITKSNNENLLKVCREEIFNLLREVGVNIE